MPYAVNILGTITVALCAILLLRGYVARRTRLSLWSGLCFAGLTLANALLFVDLMMVPQISLYPWRLGVAAASITLLLYGLVFESEK